MILSSKRFNKCHLFTCIVLLALHLSGAVAGTFELLISAENGHQTVDQIYDEFNHGNTEQTLLAVFNQNRPSAVEYYFNNRPNPNSVFYRYLAVVYPFPRDVTQVMDYLESSPLVENVSYDSNLNPLVIEPINPTPADDISIEIAFYDPNCPTIGPSTDPNGNATFIRTTGNQITLDASYFIRPPGQPIVCGGPGPYTRFELGRLEAGTYQLNFNLFRDNITLPADSSPQSLVLQTTIVVRGTQPISVPTLSFWTLMLLILAVIGLSIKLQ